MRNNRADFFLSDFFMLLKIKEELSVSVDLLTAQIFVQFTQSKPGRVKKKRINIEASL